MPDHPKGAERPRNEVRCFPFSSSSFEQVIAELSLAPEEAKPGPQIRYLAEYLEALGAASMVVESRYIDRHYMEEAALYYARCLIPKPNFCGRIHCFSAIELAASENGSLTEGSLDHLISSAAGDGEAFSRAQEALERSYLGFIVVRPLPSVPIGRTVLRFSRETKKALRTSARFPVHLLGFELHVEGLAFQQQDRAVGACATVAIWTALQRLTRHEGARAPTPSDITDAAVRHFVPFGRPFPSPGLTIEQICEALRALEFPPLVLDVKERETFLLRLDIYLRSGMPVVLAVRDSAGSWGHAVTAVGIREAPDAVQTWSLKEHEVKLHNTGYEWIYINDDRLGPYVPARLKELPDDKLGLSIDWDEGPEELEIALAVVPLYPKLRMSAFDLFEAAPELVPWLQHVAGDATLEAEIYFDRSGSYMTSLYEMPANTQRLGEFLKTAALSRYVGIIRWSADGELLMDTVWDTTDRGRVSWEVEQMLAVVCFDEAVYSQVLEFSETAGFLAC